MSSRFLLALVFLLSTSGLELKRAAAATLSATHAPVPQGSTVNLSAEGKLDWVHWGLYTDSSITRKSDVVPQISDYRLLDATNGFAFAYQYADNYNGYSWEDGYPVASVTNTPTGVWAYGTPPLESGFEITAPADTNLRVLKLYVGVFAGTGRLRAYLTDGSAAPYTNCAGQGGIGCDALENFRNGPGREFTIQYSADSPGQKLVVRWTLAALRDPTANVTLQAAALTTPTANNPPLVTLTSPADNAVFAAGAPITLSATVADLDGTVGALEFWDGLTKVGEAPAGSSEFTWSSAALGHHRLTARATDNAGATRTSLPVEVFVHGSGGILTGAMASPATFVDLTSVGTADWAHWGLVAPPDFDRKANVAAQIAEFALVGTNAAVLFTNDYRFSWTDGVPHATEAGTGSGIYITGITNGFEFAVPADTTRRELRVYVGGYGSRASFQAFLSDASAPAYVDTSHDYIYDSFTSVFTIDYAAARPGQKLFVRFKSANVYDMDYGNVALQSVALHGPPQRTFRILDPARVGATFSLSVPTEVGVSYSGEFSEIISASNWVVFTNFLGTGGPVTIGNETPSPRGFYRVRAE